MCWEGSSADIRNLGRGKGNFQVEKAKIKKMYVDSQAYNFLSYKPRPGYDFVQFIPRSA